MNSMGELYSVRLVMTPLAPRCEVGDDLECGDGAQRIRRFPSGWGGGALDELAYPASGDPDNDGGSMN
jgi:hypothetical protein